MSKNELHPRLPRDNLPTDSVGAPVTKETGREFTAFSVVFSSGRLNRDLLLAASRGTFRIHE
jgi:hypothetical protein